MLTFLKGFSPKHILYGLAALGILFGVWKVWGAVDSYIEMERLVEQQKIEIVLLEETVEVKDREIKQAKRAIEIVDEARRQAENEAESYRLLDTEINNTKDEDDGPLAPVLRRALDGLDGLRP